MRQLEAISGDVIDTLDCFDPPPSQQTNFHQSRASYFFCSKILKRFVYQSRAVNTQDEIHPRKLYMYKTNAAGSIKLSDRHIDWNFPDKISKKKKRIFCQRFYIYISRHNKFNEKST